MKFMKLSKVKVLRRISNYCTSFNQINGDQLGEWFIFVTGVLKVAFHHRCCFLTIALLPLTSFPRCCTGGFASSSRHP